jgi:hypothetical protein
MVAIPDNDIADTHGDANAAGTLDLRAADLDGIAVTDIFLDRRGQPWRGYVEIDRTRAKPPPQRAEASRENHDQNCDRADEAPYPAFARKPVAKRSEAITEPMKAGVRL